MVNQTTTRNACIATLLALAALVATAPIAAADEPTVEENGATQWEDCFYVNPWTTPPATHVSPLDCIPEQ